MKHIVLTNHAADKISEAEEKRQQVFQDRLAKDKERLAPFYKRSQYLDSKPKTALSSMKYVTWLFFWVVGFFHGFFCMWVLSRHIAIEPPTHDEAIWQAGSLGEKLVQDQLSSLPDDYLLISGYKNQKGEIDQVLVGPSGVLCVEIKYVTGTVSCVGDKWWRDKYDKYGNLMEKSVPIQDKGGRGPSRQINEAADRLEAFLQDRLGMARVHRAVVFSHPNCQLKSIKSQTVDAVTDLKSLGLFRVIRQMQKQSSRHDVQLVASLIHQNHADFANYQARRKST